MTRRPRGRRTSSVSRKSRRTTTSGASALPKAAVAIKHVPALSAPQLPQYFFSLSCAPCPALRALSMKSEKDSPPKDIPLTLTALGSFTWPHLEHVHFSSSAIGDLPSTTDGPSWPELLPCICAHNRLFPLGKKP